MDTLEQKIAALPESVFSLNGISIRPIQDDFDVWYAVVECQLAPEQQEFVNPAGFTIGRAYLHPESNIPCIIWKDDTRIGYIVLREWHDKSANTANSWSYYLDRNQQHRGYGKTAAMLAVQILQHADPAKPIKLSAEASNKKAHNLYTSIGFLHAGETDGDDMVFTLPGSNPSQL